MLTLFALWAQQVDQSGCHVVETLVWLVAALLRGHQGLQGRQEPHRGHRQQDRLQEGVQRRSRRHRRYPASPQVGHQGKLAFHLPGPRSADLERSDSKVTSFSGFGGETPKVPPKDAQCYQYYL